RGALVLKRRTWIFGGGAAAAVVLLVLGAAAAFYFYKKHQGRDIRGSSTGEFVPTETAPAPKPPPPKPKPRPPQAPDRTDRPPYGYDVERLRYLSSSLRPPFRTQWTFRARHLLEFPPAVAYGRAYIANNPGVLYAVQTATGRTSWRYTTGRCTAASPAVADEVVYMAFLNLRRAGQEACNASPGTPGLNGQAVALDARTGRPRWRRVIGPSETSPLVVGGLVYVGDWPGTLAALAAKTGRTVWPHRTGGEVKGGFALTGRRLFVGSYDHHLYALNARTGKLIWRASAQERLGSRGTFYSTPATAYGRVY